MEENITQFVEENRKAIDAYIQAHSFCHHIDPDERIEWIYGDASLYQWLENESVDGEPGA